MATVQAELVLELVEALLLVRVARVGNPTIGLHQRCGAEILILVPPVGRA
jgi:hypothetical protein